MRPIDEIINSYEYQIIQSSVDEIIDIIFILKKELELEFAQVSFFQKILDKQLLLLNKEKKKSMIDFNNMKILKNDYTICLMALRFHANTIKSLNFYILDRTKQLDLLQEKKYNIINNIER